MCDADADEELLVEIRILVRRRALRSSVGRLRRRERLRRQLGRARLSAVADDVAVADDAVAAADDVDDGLRSSAL